MNKLEKENLDKFMVVIVGLLFFSLSILLGFATGTFQDIFGMTPWGENTNRYCADGVHSNGTMFTVCHEQGWVRGKWISEDSIYYTNQKKEE